MFNYIEVLDLIYKQNLGSRDAVATVVKARALSTTSSADSKNETGIFFRILWIKTLLTNFSKNRKVFFKAKKCVPLTMKLL